MHLRVCPHIYLYWHHTSNTGAPIYKHKQPHVHFFYSYYYSLLWCLLRLFFPTRSEVRGTKKLGICIAAFSAASYCFWSTLLSAELVKARDLALLSSRFTLQPLFPGICAPSNTICRPTPSSANRFALPTTLTTKLAYSPSTISAAWCRAIWCSHTDISTPSRFPLCRE